MKGNRRQSKKRNETKLLFSVVTEKQVSKWREVPILKLLPLCRLLEKLAPKGCHNFTGQRPRKQLTVVPHPPPPSLPHPEDVREEWERDIALYQGYRFFGSKLSLNKILAFMKKCKFEEKASFLGCCSSRSRRCCCCNGSHGDGRR